MYAKHLAEREMAGTSTLSGARSGACSEKIVPSDNKDNRVEWERAQMKLCHFTLQVSKLHNENRNLRFALTQCFPLASAWHLNPGSVASYNSNIATAQTTGKSSPESRSNVGWNGKRRPRGGRESSTKFQIEFRFAAISRQLPGSTSSEYNK